MSPDTWARCAPWIEAALARSSDPETLDDVRADLISGEAQLWAADTAAVVTQIDTPDVRVWLYGGSLADMPALFASCRAWARTLGLTRMTVDRARPGWARALRPLGFVPADDVQLAYSIEGGSHGR